MSTPKITKETIFAVHDARKAPTMTNINEYIPVPTIYPEWVPVTDPKWAPGYEVSQSGEVRSPKGKILKPSLSNGQLWVSLRRNGASISTSRLDKLILTAFNGEPPANYRPLHIDSDPANCRLDNLMWAAPDAESWVPNAAAADIGAVTLDDLNLTVRSYNVLTREGIKNCLDLCERTPDDLLMMRGFTQKCLNEVTYKLYERGFALSEPSELERENGPWTQDGDYSDYAWSEPTRQEPAAPAPKRRRRRKTTVAPKGGSEVEVHRVYKLGSLQLTVNERGLGELSKKSRLTTTDMATLAELLQRAVEMNRIMGLK